MTLSTTCGERIRGMLQREASWRGLPDIFATAVRWRCHEALPDLVPHALRDDFTAEQAREAMARLLTPLGPRVLLRLDRRCRSGLPPLRVEALDAHRALLERPHGWTIAAAFSFHGDGHVRERATRWLAELPCSEVIPFLVQRMNDWVPPIQRLAREALEQRLRPAQGESLVHSVAFLVRLRGWGRTDHTTFLKRALAFLRSPALAAAREAGLRAPNPAVRREIYTLSLQAEPQRGAELVHRAAQDPERSLRRWALRQLQRQATLPDQGVIKALLLDTDLAHRQTAQLIARQLNPRPDLPRLYRELVRSAADLPTEQLRAALFGLGECGVPADVTLVLPLLDHPLTAVRRAGLYAVDWLDLEGQVERVIEALADPRRRISNDATNTLGRAAHLLLDPHRRARVEALADEGPSSFCRENARALLSTAASYRARWHAGDLQ